MGWLRETIDRAVSREVDLTIERVLPSLLEKHIERWLRQTYREAAPDLPLTEVGFRAFVAMRIRAHWPDVTETQMRAFVTDALDSIGAKHGDPAYEWTVGAAKEIADIYVNETANG